MHIAAWLRELGLERYEPVFRDNEIDWEVLPELTEGDLEKLGLPLGPRKKLLKAIAGLSAGTTAAGEIAAAPSRGAVGRRAERRQLTVLFCDLVGSTELSGRLDPEDMGRVIRAYQECCAEVIGRWGGHVARYMGDGALVYFGYPRAHEDDAERAVRAGLELTDAVGRLAVPSGERLAARVGIATGLVMVGDPLGEGPADGDAVVGQTPNLAARLQALAEPGTVAISQSTRRLVGGLFEVRELGPQHLKGFAEPLAVWRVEGEGRAEGRFEALHGEQLTPLVGREHELGILAERWAWAKDGNGQVVLLSGEPGIGKSRIVQTLRERLGAEPCIPISHYCSPYHTNSAFYPVIGQLERGARLSRDAPPEAKLARLDAVLAEMGDRRDDIVPLIAGLLGIPTGDRYPPLALTPEVQKRRTLQGLLDQLAGLAAQQPVLAVYEDAHWIDPSTLELLDLLIERIQRLPVLALITFRPEFQPPWIGQAHVTTLSIGRLGRRRVADLIAHVTGDKPLPAEVLGQIVAKTDGVPLFVEELTRTVLESGVLRDQGDRYALAGPLPPLAIPATLHDSLMARLDRLAPVKELAQTAAALGREFSHTVLAAVAPMREADLREALEQLVESGLIMRHGTPPEASYGFKHTLVQDAAYESLLKSRRQQLHARIAKVLEEEFPEIAEKEPEVFAHHYTRANLTDQAVSYWEKAGQRALARAAAAEAVANFSKGLELLSTLSDGVERTRRELALQIALAGALLTAKGYAAPETARAYDRALELCRRVGETPQLAVSLYGHFVVPTLRGELETAHQLAEEVQRLAQRQDDAILLTTGHAVVGISAMWLGKLDTARSELERLLGSDDTALLRSSAAHYPQDLRVSSLSFLSLTLLLLGHLDRARVREHEALAEAEELHQFGTLAMAQTFACLLAHVRRDQLSVGQWAEAVIAFTAESGAQLFLAFATYFRGWARVAEGKLEPGIEDMRHGLAAWRATGAGLHVPYLLALLGEALGKTGEGTQGANLVAEALALAEQTGEHWFEAELHRLRGELLLALPEANLAEAEGCFHRALRIAREQGARLWELRASMSLARLWRDQGQRTEAIGLLAPVYGWFTEGFDTADLKDARGLLDELR